MVCQFTSKSVKVIRGWLITMMFRWKFKSSFEYLGFKFSEIYLDLTSKPHDCFPLFSVVGSRAWINTNRHWRVIWAHIQVFCIWEIPQILLSVDGKSRRGIINNASIDPFWCNIRYENTFINGLIFSYNRVSGGSCLVQSQLILMYI